MPRKPHNDPEPAESVDPVGDDYAEPPFVTPEGDAPRVVFADEIEDLIKAEQVDGYAPFDIAQAKPSVHGTPEKPMGLRDEAGNALPTFDERHKEDFSGLAFLGSLSKTFEWLGHQFVIRTLTVDDQLHLATLTKDFGGTLGDGLSYRTAIAALCVDTIDGNSLPVPLGEEAGFAYAQMRFDYARRHWFQPVVDEIYSQYIELDLKTRQVVDAMGKAYASTD